MARVRNHKAEYAARKAKAQKLGYSGVSEYRRTRKSLALPRTRRTPSKRAAQRYSPVTFQKKPRTTNGIARLRREARAWSKKHSHSQRSKYRPDMSDEQVRAYHNAYVKRVEGMSRRKAGRQKRHNIFDYLRGYDFIDQDLDWHEDWKSDADAV